MQGESLEGAWKGRMYSFRKWLLSASGTCAPGTEQTGQKQLLVSVYQEWADLVISIRHCTEDGRQSSLI